MSYPTYLVHFNPNHDKLGRFTFSKSGSISNGNATKIDNYKGKMYFISEKKIENSKLTPRIPSNYFTDNGYEDNFTPRVCFAPTIEQCLAGLSKNVDGKSFYVYSPKDISKLSVYKPNTKAVPDSKITGELWVIEPVEMQSMGTIKVTGNAGSDGKMFSYGDRQATLYDDWTYEFDGELKHFNPNHDPKTGRFTFSKNQTMDSKVRNYTKVIDSLSDEEYRLFSDGWNREDEKRFIKEYAKTFKDNEKTRVFISKYGNVTLASLETNGLGDPEWNIGWATNPKNRGTGVTQANIKEAISFIRKFSDVPIGAIIEQQNMPSRKTAEKAGFRDAGYTRMDDGSVRKRYIYD